MQFAPNGASIHFLPPYFCRNKQLKKVGMNINATSQRLCAWSGVVANVFWVFGFFAITYWLAPHGPSWTAEETKEFWTTRNRALIDWGLVLYGFGGALYMPWSAGIAAQIKRIEGKNSVFTYTIIGLGACFVWVFLLAWVLWEIIAYRADIMDANLMLILDNLAWITNLSPVNIVLIQGIAIGLPILMDKSAKPVFPKWFGWFSIIAVFTFLPGSFSGFFYEGPVAYDGLFSYWIPLGTYLIWMSVTTWQLLQNIKQQEAEAKLINA